MSNKYGRLFIKKILAIVLFISLLLQSSIVIYASNENDEANKNKVKTEATKVKEIKEYREKNSETYLLSDGTYECIIYADDKYYLDNTGNYSEIDNSIISENQEIDGLEYTYSNRSNSLDVNFMDGKECNIQISNNNESISFSPVDENESYLEIGQELVSNDSVISENTIMQEVAENVNIFKNSSGKYSNIYENVDFNYVIENDSIKEYIVLKDKTSPSKFTFDFNLNNLNVIEENNTIYFVNSYGEKVFEIGSFFAVDCNGAYTEDIKYNYEIVEKTMKLEIILSEDYLNDSTRAFPVVIDPTILVTGQYSTYDSYISTLYPSTNFYMNSYLRTGKDTSYGIRRTYIKFDLPTGIKSGRVLSSYIRIEKYSGAVPATKAYRVTGPWSSSTITWNNYAPITTTYCSDTANYDGSGNWYDMFITTIVKNQMAGIYPNYGYMIRDNNESNTSQWTTFYSSDAPSPHKPELHVIYSSDIYGGNRPYVSSTGIAQNCMGYAINYPQFITGSDLGLTASELANTSTYDQLLTLIYNKSLVWMNNHGINYNTINASNSEIEYFQYRAVLRVGYDDINGNGLLDYPSEGVDYHWWYQTNTGQWAEKAGSTDSRLVPGTNLNTNPFYDSNWLIYFPYRSECKYFAIKY